MKVLEFIEPQMNDAQFIIVDESMIESKDWGEIYNQYGQCEGEEQGIETDCVEYHDGHNYRSAPIHDGTYPHPVYRYADNADESDVLKHIKKADFGQYERGIATAETKKYKFIKSQFAGSYGIDVICK